MLKPITSQKYILSILKNKTKKKTLVFSKYKHSWLSTAFFNVCKPCIVSIVLRKDSCPSLPFHYLDLELSPYIG